jgi:3'(2'), 5'-bisphosphate nucleotidase
MTALNASLISEIRELAEEAGREIMKYYRSGDWTVTAKGDESPLTQADLAANDIIMRGLQKLTHEPIVSEESNPKSVVVQDKFWLVDPLDGTRDFVSRKDTFVVCIALVENFYPAFGLIHSPVTDETWWAEKNNGAFNGDGKRLRLTNQRERLIAAGSRSMPSERMQMFYDHFDVQEVQRYGSALKFCRLAEGEIDLYPRFGPTSEWDTAAGQIIVEEAGGKVLDITTGERLRYAKPGFENRGGFMASRADLDLLSPLRAKGLIKS